MRKNFKYLALKFVLLQIIVVYYFMFAGSKEQSSKVDQIILNKPIKKLDLLLRRKEENFLRNPVWEQMNEKTFFKRTSAFYVIERSLLRIYCVCKNIICF